MAYSKEFVTFVTEQMREAGNVTYRLMFGAYALYLEGKMIGIVGENQVFIKPTEAGKAVFPDISSMPPYEGASDYYLVEELEDTERLGQFIRATWAELPFPKPKKRK